MAQNRELFRIVIDRTGRIHCGAKLLRCLVVNLTDKGFQLQVEGSFAIGDLPHLEFPLTEREPLACIVKVMYARPPLIGTVITSVPSDHQTLLSGFIDEVNTISLMGY